MKKLIIASARAAAFTTPADPQRLRARIDPASGERCRGIAILSVSRTF